MTVCLTIVILFLSSAAGTFAQPWQPGGNLEPDSPNALEGPIKVYQKIVSGADAERCPMYPSCSAYAQQAFRKNGWLMGWIMACDRLLRCGRDEVRLSPPLRSDGRLLTYDPVRNNDFWWKQDRSLHAH
jgi:putative component of membrane protein insertase Oxa1/YidC/SpoIIIJ protein YidD